MIDADQLREGNVIININASNNTKRYIAVNYENKGWIRQDSEFYEYVELTEKLLSKTDLILDNGNYAFGHNNLFSIRNVDGIFRLLYDNIVTVKGIIYLHELQNIFWALCSYELVLDLNLNEIIE